jgi:hypothetical protein
MTAFSKSFEFIINTGSFTATSVSIPSAAMAPNGSRVFNSLPEKGDGYYGASDGVHTVTYTVTPNFVGNLSMQATLAITPAEVDWFTVTNTTVSYDYSIEPATTTTNYTNFVGNFVWVRARAERSDDVPNGSIMFVNYNH